MEFRLKDEDSLKCYCCGCELDDDHVGIQCQEDHDLCQECSKYYIEDMLSKPTTKIPPRCSMCNCELSCALVEKQMTPEQFSVYFMHMSMKHIDQNDQVVKCPFCDYFEIWNKDCTSNFFYCKKEGCKKESCSVCHKEFKVPSSDYNIPHSELEEITAEMMSHTKCYEHKQIKEDWDKAIDEGTRRRCPTCGVGDMNNDVCTHMRCQNCQAEWCYFCGKAFDDLDKNPAKNTIFGHNDDWKTNSKRCPLYLRRIYQIDDRYSENDLECKMLFHKLLTYASIRKFFEKYNQNDFDELCQTFSAVQNHGYDLEEAMSMDITLIHR